MELHNLINYKAKTLKKFYTAVCVGSDGVIGAAGSDSGTAGSGAIGVGSSTGTMGSGVVGGASAPGV